MTIGKTLSSLALAGALAVLAVPASSQTTMPNQRETTRSPSMDAQSPERMQEMMRDMMQEMMRQDRSQGRWEGSGRMRDWSERRGRDGMGPRDMMRDRAGSRGMMHGAGMRIMFAIMDADGDGALSLEEVQNFHERIFNTIDQDGDNEITMEEVREFFSSSNQ